MNRMLHTPEGVRDIFAPEYKRTKAVERAMVDVVERTGFEPIRTPSFEFFDVFSREVGSIPSKELYKFFDHEGNTLCLRPDFTPSIARAASKLDTGSSVPLRLYYNGNVFINHLSYQGHLMESRQFGAELIGDDSVEADAEIVATAVSTLLATGLSEFKLSISHSSIYNGLVKAAGLSDEDELLVRERIQNKNFFGLEEILTDRGIDEKLKKLFLRLDTMAVSAKELSETLGAMDSFENIAKVISYFEEFYDLLTKYGVSEYISFELGLLSEYRYYTGILMTGYTYGSGQPIVKGGRYDGLMSYFGKEAPAIGFAVSVDLLLNALDRQGVNSAKSEKRTVILYNKAGRFTAIERANKLRSYGTVTVMQRFSDDEEKKRLSSLYENDTVIVCEEV